MNRDLMMHVERAVRPVRTQCFQKLLMREELYGLLEDIYTEERKRSDEETAIAAAIRRFGPAAALTAELEESLTWQDRLFHLGDRLLRRRDGESVLRHAARLAGILFLYWAVCLVPLIAMFRFTGGAPDGERVGIALLLCFGCVTFFWTLLVHATVWSFNRNRWTTVSVSTIALSPAASGALVLLAGFTVQWISTLDPAVALQGLWAWTPISLVGAATLPLFSGVVVRRYRREAPWNSLVLE